MKLPAITEAKWQQQVIQLAGTLGWFCAHFRGVRVQRKDGTCFWQTPVQAQGKGFPDLVLVRGPRLIFVELKRGPREKPSPEQEVWLAKLRQTEAEVYLWRPQDFDRIQEILR